LRNAIRLGCGVGALFLTVVVATGSAAGDTAPPTLPPVFGGTASVSGLLEHLDSVPSALPTQQPFYASFGSADSTYSELTLFAQALPYNPGASVVGLGALLCTAAPPGTPIVCNLPQFPLIAIANSQHPDSSVGFSPQPGANLGLSGVSAISAVAHADPNLVSTNDNIAGLDETGILHIGSMQTSTNQSFQGNTMVVTASAHDNDINLVNGLIHIGSITATSTTTTDGNSVHTHSDDSSIGGVTVAGQAATIDENGISVMGSTLLPASQLLALNQSLQKTLQSLGITIRFIGHTTPQSVLQPKTCSRGEADGLVIGYTHNITSLGNFNGLYYDHPADADAGADEPREHRQHRRHRHHPRQRHVGLHQ
jgi:hypothetical protein